MNQPFSTLVSAHLGRWIVSCAHCDRVAPHGAFEAAIADDRQHARDQQFNYHSTSLATKVRIPGAIPMIESTMRLLQGRGARFLGFLTAAAVLLASGNGAATTRDIAGWSDTKWGMRLSEIRALHPELTIGEDFLGFKAGIIPVEIAGKPFVAYLSFDNVGGNRASDDTSPEPPQDKWKLASVELQLKDPNFIFVCQEVVKSLTGKYGSPTKYMGGNPWWILPTTTIIEAGGLLPQTCWIRYIPTKVAGSENL